MARFQPCHGKNECRDDGERCITCGRQLTEVAQLRDGIDTLATLAVDFGYDNVEEYAGYVARKLFKTINHRREQAA